MADILSAIVPAVRRLLARHGLDGEDATAADPFPEATPLLAGWAAASVRGLAASNPVYASSTSRADGDETLRCRFSRSSVEAERPNQRSFVLDPPGSELSLGHRTGGSDDDITFPTHRSRNPQDASELGR